MRLASLISGLGLIWVVAHAVIAAHAHTSGTTGYASLSVHRSTVRYRVTLAVAALPSHMAEDLRLVQHGNLQARERLLNIVRQTIAVRANEIRCEPGPGLVDVPDSEATNLSMLVDFACPSGVRSVQIRDDIFDVLGRDHHTLMKIESSHGVRQFVLEPAAREVRLEVGDSATRGAGTFLMLGIHHILSGYDHLLFLFGLLLSGGTIFALAKMITAFTLAHSVTLSLAVLDVIAVSDRLVEAVIALSIAFVAAENLAPRPAVSRRWVVSFVFGLVHGFGFSSALRELGLSRGGVAVALLSFNGGVEIGQALVIAILLPCLMLLRRSQWAARAVVVSSIAILATGMILFVERLFM
jgi:hypothetical protein